MKVPLKKLRFIYRDFCGIRIAAVEDPTGWFAAVYSMNPRSDTPVAHDSWRHPVADPAKKRAIQLAAAHLGKDIPDGPWNGETPGTQI